MWGIELTIYSLLAQNRKLNTRARVWLSVGSPAIRSFTFSSTLWRTNFNLEPFLVAMRPTDDDDDGCDMRSFVHSRTVWRFVVASVFVGCRAWLCRSSFCSPIIWSMNSFFFVFGAIEVETLCAYVFDFDGTVNLLSDGTARSGDEKIINKTTLLEKWRKRMNDVSLFLGNRMNYFLIMRSRGGR